MKAHLTTNNENGVPDLTGRGYPPAADFTGGWQNWRLYQLLATLFFIGFTLWYQFEWFVSGAMLAETATNYYPAAKSDDIFNKLLTTDTGYIPLPQRLISAAFEASGVSAGQLPYFYQSIALIFGGLFIATFAHACFRPLVGDDRVRALFCLVFCFTMTFDVRTFVNFTYIGIYYAIPVIALAMERDGRDAPWWAWFLPLLMISKPVMIALLPVIAIALIYAKPRFRIILILSLFALVTQFVRLIVSQQSGVGFPESDATLLTKLASSIASGAGIIGGYAAGPVAQYILAMITPWLAVCIGLALSIGIAAILLQQWRRPPPLLMTGIIVVYAMATLNSFANANSWNLELDMVRYIFLERWAVGCLAGTLFVLPAAGQWLVQTPFYKASPMRRIALFPIAALWLALSAWPVLASYAQPEPFPETGNSYWTDLADRIEAGDPVCVPVDPYVPPKYVYIYLRNCMPLNEAPLPDAPKQPLAGKVDIALASGAQDHPLLAMLVVVYPERAGTVTLRAHVTDASAREVTFTGERDIGTEGGIVLLSPPDGTPVAARSTIRLEAPPHVRIVHQANGLPWVQQFGLTSQPVEMMNGGERPR